MGPERGAVVAVLATVLAVAGCSDHAPSIPAKVGTAAPASTRGPQKISSAWRAVEVGTVFELETVTQLENKALAPVVKTRQTVLAKDDEGVTLRIETKTPGVESSPQDVKISFTALEVQPKAPSDQCPEKPVAPKPRTTTASEICKVPAGSFDCVKTTIEFRQGAVTRSTETWMARDLPVAVKAVMTNENMASTTRLTKVVIGSTRGS